MKIIRKFSGANDFLSNFYTAPTKFEGLVFSTAENAFQAAKTLHIPTRRLFLDVPPGVAKQMGRQADLRPDWESVKQQVMYDCVLSKFRDNSDLWLKLNMTKDAGFIEGNTWHDNYWGDCVCSDCSGYVGKNQLGLILMAVRAHLRGEPARVWKR